jgi:hypothetical protein
MKRRQTMKKMGLSEKQIKIVEQKEDFSYNLFKVSAESNN